ncbi:MAG: hypothetical protein ACREPI_10180, partial [Candidatus Dormibacterales bacterium]
MPRPVEPARVRHLYRLHFADARRERLFVSSVSFFGTFAAVRALTHAIRRGLGPFRNLSMGGTHIHHAVWGIGTLLGVGYAWLAGVGTAGPQPPGRASTVTAGLYGAGAALTLDEFALWLNLEDVYWTREGRESVDAVILFGALLSIGLWGGPFFRALVREARGRCARLPGEAGRVEPRSRRSTALQKARQDLGTGQGEAHAMARVPARDEKVGAA